VANTIGMVDVAWPNRNRLTSMKVYAGPLGLTLVPVDARGLNALEEAFATMVKERAQAVVVLGDPVLFDYRDQIVIAALGNQMPAISGAKQFAEAGENVAIEYRFANGEMERSPARPSDLLRTL
jgi:ABC-type uncharacterized transport system substrate-binding protein